jgi:peptide-methionine (R)-S-oxide reductase
MGKVTKTDEQWQAELDDMQNKVCSQKGTEQAFTGEYWDCKEEGLYVCACCGNKLFDSVNKYDSSSGWPSFWEAIDRNEVKTERDNSHGMQRTEVLCRQCDAHLGHLFPDGPEPTGLRYCINSASLKLKKRETR